MAWKCQEGMVLQFFAEVKKWAQFMKYSIKVELNVKEVKGVYFNPSIKSDVWKLVSGRELLMFKLDL